MEGSLPYAWPYDGNLRPDNTALIVIDMQVDFCGFGGYVDLMGYNISLTRAPIKPIQCVLAACRASGLTIIHTREGHRRDLADLPANKLWRSQQIGAGIGSPGPSGSRVLVRGEPGWEIITELQPLEGEVIIDKPGKGSFYATDLDLILKCRGIRNLILTGVTTDVCVHTTMREANDKGYECLLLTDCTAATDPYNHAAAIKMIQMQGGVFGAVSDSAALINALQAMSPSKALDANPANGSLEASAAGAVCAPALVTVPAQPYPYELPVHKAALIMIDFQKDFMCEGGFGDALGNDIKQLQACLPAAAKLLAACRAVGMTVVHTLEGHKQDLSDLHPAKARRGNMPAGSRIGDEGAMGRILVTGEPGNDLVEEVAAIKGEKLLPKPGKGAFYNTDLEPYLRSRGVTHLLIAGVTTEVCVQTTMREANDRGYECLLVSDATASYFPAFKEATLQMVVAQGGIVGWVADSSAVAKALADTV